MEYKQKSGINHVSVLSSEINFVINLFLAGLIGGFSYLSLVIIALCREAAHSIPLAFFFIATFVLSTFLLIITRDRIPNYYITIVDRRNYCRTNDGNVGVGHANGTSFVERIASDLFYSDQIKIGKLIFILCLGWILGIPSALLLTTEDPLEYFPSLLNLIIFFLIPNAVIASLVITNVANSVRACRQFADIKNRLVCALEKDVVSLDRKFPDSDDVIPCNLEGKTIEGELFCEDISDDELNDCECETFDFDSTHSSNLSDEELWKIETKSLIFDNPTILEKGLRASAMDFRIGKWCIDLLLKDINNDFLIVNLVYGEGSEEDAHTAINRRATFRARYGCNPRVMVIGHSFSDDFASIAVDEGIEFLREMIEEEFENDYKADDNDLTTNDDFEGTNEGSLPKSSKVVTNISSTNSLDKHSNSSGKFPNYSISYNDEEYYGKRIRKEFDIHFK